MIERFTQMCMSYLRLRQLENLGVVGPEENSNKTTNKHAHRHQQQRQDSTSHHHHNQKPQVDIYDKIKKLKKHRLLQARIQTSIFTLKSLIRVAKEHDLTNNFRAVVEDTQQEEKRVVVIKSSDNLGGGFDM